MKRVNISISRAQDGTYSAYCSEHPVLLGMGESIADAICDLKETLRITKEEIGREHAAAYPEWLDEDYEFVVRWDIQDLLTYYAGIITPASLSRISGIHQKQLWSYMHGLSKPRKAQLDRIESALHKLGHELLNTSF